MKTNQEIVEDAYNKLNNAFSNYMVGDMDNPRCNYMNDDVNEETIEEINYEGEILARKLIRYNASGHDIKNWIKILIDHKNNDEELSFKINGNEGDIYDSKKLIESLCLCYQLDENRPDMIKSFINGFLNSFNLEDNK